MSLQECPVLHPSPQEFSHFYQYIHSLDYKYKNDFGMVKIVPPEGWKPQSADYQHRLLTLKVKNAIEQMIQGRNGYYQSRNIVQKEMPYRRYRAYSEKQSQSVEGKSAQEKEQLFWKTVMYSPPVYGSDLTGSLMDETAGEWNLNSLDSLLRYAVPHRIKGVTEPYCYIGTWKAFFSWHKEDLDLSAINYIHEGEPKIWYSVAPQDSHLLQEVAQKHYRQQYLQCPQFLRHKTFLIHPQALIKECPTTHHAGEIMLVFGGAYHEGFNCGFNIAEAVNYATVDWLRQILTTQPCGCSRKSVKASIESILYNLEESEMFEELLGIEEFQKVREYVQQKQAEEDAADPTVIGEPQGEVQSSKQVKELPKTSEDTNKKKTKPIKKQEKKGKGKPLISHSEKQHFENNNQIPANS